ncbi:MAG: DUF115 domain-containing protein [Treponema sp.]|nr:DUF115 domain-containing protein [Treponema sp.]
MGCWETNSAILGKRYPGLLEAILGGGDGLADEEPKDEDLKIETAASGAPTLAIRGLHVHSPRDPQREGQRLAESLAAGGENSANTEGAAAPAIVLGFGLGYAAQALAELAPRRPVIIVEKNISILRLAFEQRELHSLLSRDGIAFVPGGSGEGVIKALSLFEKNPGERSAPLILRNRALVSIDEQWYGTVENRIRAWAMRDDVNMATLKRFGGRWVRNLWRNMGAIRDLPGISRLAGLASEGEPLPVFLAAAGPSLDHAATLLPEIQKRCIVVAVDTSLRFMQSNGVHPDFALVVDPQFWNSRHLDRCGSPHTRLVIESAVYPPVSRLSCKGMYLCGSLFPLGKFIEQRVDPKGDLGAGGSVATTAWDFARSLGAREIWIAGLDLSYPGLRTHYRGALFEERPLPNRSGQAPARPGWFTPCVTASRLTPRQFPADRSSPTAAFPSMPPGLRTASASTPAYAITAFPRAALPSRALNRRRRKASLPCRNAAKKLAAALRRRVPASRRIFSSGASGGGGRRVTKTPLPPCAAALGRYRRPASEARRSLGGHWGEWEMGNGEWVTGGKFLRGLTQLTALLPIAR